MGLVFYNSSNIVFRVIHQWDMNRVIKIAGVTVSEDMRYEVHFGNQSMRKTVASDVSAESITIKDDLGEDVTIDVIKTVIPNELTSQPLPIDVYVYTINRLTNETMTIEHGILTVALRCKPAGLAEASGDFL